MKNLIKKFCLLLTLLCISLATNANSSSFAQTKYPIILVHGFMGADKVGGSDYFYRIPAALEKAGATVYIALVSPVQGAEARGEQLLTQVQNVLALTGAEKVNLIGHSLGGPTIRYVASIHPELVASVTSIAGTNKGSKVADLYLNKTQNSLFLHNHKITEKILRLMFKMHTLGNKPSNFEWDVAQAMQAMSTAGAHAFNLKYPEALPVNCYSEGQEQVNGVYYYSWTGISPKTVFFDPADSLLRFTSKAFGSELNDGLVSQCSAGLGKIIRNNYKHNHMDEVNQTLGLVPIYEANPVTIYRIHANRLKQAGL